MMNFLLGLLAGCLIACVATVAALRQPAVQARFGLVAPAVALACPPVRPEPRCPAHAEGRTAEAKAAEADALFSRRRFWYVAP